MRKALRALATLALCFTICSVKATGQYENGVLVLDTDNFEKAIDKYEFLLVKFYAPWCGASKMLGVQYNEAAAILTKQDPPVMVAKVDGSVHKDLSDAMGVTQFPTVFFFKNGEKIDFTGQRDKKGIVDWVNRKAGPPSFEVDCNTLQSKMKEMKDDRLALNYFGDIQMALFDTFKLAARSVDLEK